MHDECAYRHVCAVELCFCAINKISYDAYCIAFPLRNTSYQYHSISTEIQMYLCGCTHAHVWPAARTEFTDSSQWHYTHPEFNFQLHVVNTYSSQGASSPKSCSFALVHEWAKMGKVQIFDIKCIKSSATIPFLLHLFFSMPFLHLSLCGVRFYWICWPCTAFIPTQN